MDGTFLQISPSELSFDFELRKAIVSVLQLKNVADESVAFKVKTTAPKKYVVRPSSGIVEKGSTKDIQVILQPQKEPLASYQPCKDKFLIQSIATKGNTEVTSDMFSNLAEIQQTKLRVNMRPGKSPPSPVPEGIESESPLRDVGNVNAMQSKENINQRLMKSLGARNSKSVMQAQQVSGAPPAGGFGLITLLLVAILAFIIGYLAQDLPVLDELKDRLSGSLDFLN